MYIYIYIGNAVHTGAPAKRKRAQVGAQEQSQAALSNAPPSEKSVLEDKARIEKELSELKLRWDEMVATSGNDKEEIKKLMQKIVKKQDEHTKALETQAKAWGKEKQGLEEKWKKEQRAKLLAFYDA